MRRKIANILLDDTPQFLEAPGLLMHADAANHRSEDHPEAWALHGPGRYDFTTFFNALSSAKLRTYTIAKSFSLHLEYRGAAASWVQTRADAYSWDAQEMSETQRDLPASDEWKAADIPLVVRDDDVVDGFVLRVAEKGIVYVRDSYYFTEVDEADLRPVELAICTTTFKKESYIERNIRLVKEEILGSGEEIARHLTDHVVDNGRTLDVAKLEGPHVHIHPNDNVGGSGGYARGMIAAMEQTPKATHCLLMDDDVIISPESIKRTYNLLRIVKDEYKDAFVSGAMMDLFEPQTRWEDVGFVTFNGNCVPLKGPTNITLLHEVVRNELDLRHLEDPAHADTTQLYAGWWYCVIPMTQIERNGLPLPVFVRYDDIEYGLRCKPKFITLNGICLWHPSFPRRYSAAVERYQVMRNQFIGHFTTDMAPMSDFVDKLYHTVQLELKKFNYTNAGLALDGFEDFLKGPAFIEQPGVVEKCFMDANKHAEKLLPFHELLKQGKEEHIDLSFMPEVDVQKDSDNTEFRSLPERLIDFMTFNGQRIDLGYLKQDTVGFIDVAGWLYPASEIRRKDTIVAVDMENQRGVIRHIDRKRFREVWDRYRRDMRYYQANKDRLKREYSAERAKITSVAWWKRYLGMEQEG